MALEKFHYTTSTGKKITLPKFQDLMTFGLARKLRKLDQAEQVFELVEAAADEDALAVIDTFRHDEIEPFFAAWQADSGVTVGESSASATS